MTTTPSAPLCNPCGRKRFGTHERRPSQLNRAETMTSSHTYEQLAHFISHEMRMSHVYQPVMLRELLKRKGTATVTQIAKALLAEDRSQIEYYEQITKNMVGRVLTANRGITKRDGATYQLKDFSQLSKEEIGDLLQLCDAKVAEYL